MPQNPQIEKILDRNPYLGVVGVDVGGEGGREGGPGEVGQQQVGGRGGDLVELHNRRPQHAQQRCIYIDLLYYIINVIDVTL